MTAAARRPRWALAVHGGAGTIRRADLTPDVARAYRDGLTHVLDLGAAVLDAGGGALDAVEAVVAALEDAPLWNAGRGAVLASDGSVELDAAIMDGRTRAAGGVATVRQVRNPVRLARAVMERSPHVLLVGDGAEAFAEQHGLALVTPAYFWTARRWAQLERTRRGAGEDVATRSEDTAMDPGLGSSGPDDGTVGTVGAVALDAAGHLAAATSTGGLTNKRPGRVSDSAIIGAGTYADDRTCAVSTTGTGELFLRGVVAYDVAARMRYGRQTVLAAAEAAVGRELALLGGPGSGGLIALDRTGAIAMPFNTEGMYRGWAVAGGQQSVHIHRDG